MKNFADGINPTLIDDPIVRRYFATIKEFLTEQQRALAKIVPAENNPTGSVSTEVPVAPIINTRLIYAWRANGPYIVDTDVDGRLVVPTAFTITAIKLFRDTPGTSGSTTIDVNKNGTTMYAVNPSSKPSIPYTSTIYHAVLPSTVSLQAGDTLSIDIDAIEAGDPQNLAVVIEGT